MKIATWNVNSLKVRLEQVLYWLEVSNCDVLALQELKLDNDNFPKNIFIEKGYHVIFNGQKTYNGVAIISRYPILDPEYDIPNYDDIQKRVIAGTINGIRIICAYVVNGENVNSDKYIYKLNWLDQFKRYNENNLKVTDRLIVLGDYNIAPEDRDVYNPIEWKDKVLCSIPERKHFKELLELGLYDSFRLFNQNNQQYTWWDYRNFAFKRKLGLRIDHILISESIKKIATECIIDTVPRNNERPSDHTPVVLTITTY